MQKFGISTALLTPFTQNGDVDVSRLSAHALSVLKKGADCVTLFGTTGEGASIGTEERAAAIEALLTAGCPAEKIILGIAANATSDAIQQVDEGQRFGVNDFLLLPPFYFKGPDEVGLFDWHMEVFQGTNAAARYILYHIPQVSGVGLPVSLVARLVVANQGRIRAVKDSSGDWDNACELLGLDTVTVLIGDERILHRAVELGAGGAISGMANLYADRMKRIVEAAQEDTALSEEVTRIVSVPVIPALKSVLAQQSGDPAWERLRPPLTPLDAASRALVLGDGAGGA